jgi:hypothetical protein
VDNGETQERGQAALRDAHRLGALGVDDFVSMDSLVWVTVGGEVGSCRGVHGGVSKVGIWVLGKL